jgi:ATP:ADP antiporter, AAA family
MYSFILRQFNIDKKEAGFVFLLFISGGFLGIFLSSFDIASHTIFLDVFHQKALAHAYLYSGLIGVLIFYIYSLAYKRLAVKRFNLINLSFIFLITAVYFISALLYRSTRWSAFMGLTIMFPITLLALINFWRYIRKLLYPEQLRRLFPTIEIGFMLGIIAGSLGSFGILFFYNLPALPLITLIAIASHFIMQFPLNTVHRHAGVFNYQRNKYVPARSSFLLFSSKFTNFLFFFALLSAIIGFLTHFGFIIYTRSSFQNSIGMSKFYGLFIGAMFLFIFCIQRFLLTRLLYTYDSPYSLILMPVAMLIILAVTFIFYLTFGDNAALARFTFLFILLGMNKIVYETSKYNIQIPSLRTLFHTLDVRFTQVIYPRIEGSIVMLGMLIAGALIIGMLAVNFYSVFIILLISFVLTLIWFYFGVRLIKAYKSALQNSYKKLRLSRSIEQSRESYNEKIRKILVGANPLRVINALKLSAHIEPLTYQNSLRRMLANPEPKVQAYVLECINEEALLDLLPDLKKVMPTSELSEKLITKTINEFEKKINFLDDKHDLESMINSLEVRDRVLASEIIGNRKDLTYSSALINLSHEFEPDVKKAAVKAMSKISSADHCYVLLELLQSPQFHAYAFETLVAIGEPTVEYLERLFLNPATDDKLLARVVKIYGKIATDRTIDLLLNKLENQSRRVMIQTIEALHESKFQASALNIHRILNIIVRVISNIGWNYLIFISLPGREKYEELRKAYYNEIELNYDLLFDLLSLAYNPHAIREIRELITNGSQSDISHGLELLDHFIFEDIKPVLFPIMENIPPKEIVKKLQYYFPIENMTEEEMISSTLTRDYNLLSYYPRICAMQLTLEMPGNEVSDELVANLFHPNRMIREVATAVIFKKNPEKFTSVAERLEQSILFELTDVIHNLTKPDELLLIDKFILLRQTLRIFQLDEEILIDVAQAMQVKKFKSGQEIDLSVHSEDYTLFIIISDNVYFNGIKMGNTIHGKYELYYAKILVNCGVSNISFQQDSTILCLNDESVENLLFDYTEMANCVLSCVEQFKIAV